MWQNSRMVNLGKRVNMEGHAEEEQDNSQGQSSALPFIG